jgi:Holliday junction resolvase RusA-like endonuclease
LAWSVARAPLTCPVELHITALFQRPKRLLHRPLGTLAKSKPMVREMHCGRVDADNVAKAVCDALEKAGVIRNDSQVWSLKIEKHYAGPDEEARVIVSLSW